MKALYCRIEKNCCGGADNMIGTEFFRGQGFGNQLFCYVAARCVAEDGGHVFATAGQEHFGAPRWNKKGAYFMDINLGVGAKKTDFSAVYEEAQERLFLETSEHDKMYGCDVRGYDENLPRVPDGTLILGNMQSERYFAHRRGDIKKWLKVRPEYDSMELSSDDLCVINMRGGEYAGLKELFLERDYWLKGMDNMKKINPGMRFVVVTDDLKTARKVLPEIPARHGDLAADYVSIKNARYLLLSNSSFAFFPAFTSDTVKYIIAPKYWARHNVSDGYWSTAQNIYAGWHYQDRAGELCTGQECILELEKYKRNI